MHHRDLDGRSSALLLRLARAWLGVTAVAAAVNLGFACRNGFSVFFADHWVWLGNYSWTGLARTLWTPLNEHRVVVPGFLYALDLTVFRGSFVLLKAILLLGHVGCAYLLIRPVYTAQYMPRTLAYFYSGFVLVWSTWFIQGNNLFWPFQICIVLCGLFALAAATALAGSFGEASQRRLVAALASAALATFCFGHGILLWPVLLAVAIGARLGPIRLAMLFGAAMTCFAVYFWNYPLPPSLTQASTLLSNPIRLPWFLSLFVGIPIFLPGTSDSGVVTSVPLHGVVAIGIAITVYSLFRHFTSLEGSRDRARSVFLAVILLTFAAAGTAAVARGASSPFAALADRYATIAIHFWISVVALVTLRIARYSAKPPWLTPVWCLCLVLAGLYTIPSHLTWGRHKSNENHRKNIAFQGLINGEPDRELVEREIYLSLEQVEVLSRLVIAKHLANYGNYRFLGQHDRKQPFGEGVQEDARKWCTQSDKSASPLSANLGFFKDGVWRLDQDGNAIWEGPPVDRLVRLGQAGDSPMVGDWNGDGKTRIGFFRNGMWLLDYNGNGRWDGPSADRLYWWGQTGDMAVAGDWNGDSSDEVGIFRSGLWVLDHNGNGRWDGPPVDRLVRLGQAGDSPVVGDWNGDGKTKIGFFRNGMWLLDYNGNGRWDGPSADRLYWWGQTGDMAVAGDWNGDSSDEVGIFRSGLWVLDHNGNGRWDGPGIDRLHCLGRSGEMPVTGRW